MKHFFFQRINSGAGILLISILLFVFPGISAAQLSHGGQPAAPALARSVNDGVVINLNSPELTEIQKQDQIAMEAGMPERMGVNIPVDISIDNVGAIIKKDGFSETWCVNIRCSGAIGLGLYFSEFHLPAGSVMFIYSADKSQVLGAFTSENNQTDGLFAIEVVKGESIVVEYTYPLTESVSKPFRISEVLFVYKPMMFPGDKSPKQSLSGNCEVNAACSEGDNWRNQIKSVVRILIKNGNSSYWCTGTVMNNTGADFSPLLLTADHCARTYSGAYASPDDVSQWIFYFEYETPGCDDVVVQDNKTLTGAVKLASSSPQDNNGSDFYLVRLHDQIPVNYAPFYTGWSRSGEMSGSGVGIHHPSGDVKKISTYTQTLTSDQWGTVPGTHFRVVWSETVNGHGVTEGGSSGSPIFDSEGRFIGQLTGGESGCTNLTGPDFYGKMAYSWESNGTHDSTRLKPWLDPLNTGQLSTGGISCTVNFNADTNTIAVGRSANFHDLSTITPLTWSWYFEGGKPETSADPNPSGIVYDRVGKFNVKLTVTSETGEYSVIREDLIKVLPVILFDADSKEFKVILGNSASRKNSITIMNALGMVVRNIDDFCTGQDICSLDLSGLPAGLYIVRVSSEDYSETSKLLFPGN